MMSKEEHLLGWKASSTTSWRPRDRKSQAEEELQVEEGRRLVPLIVDELLTEFDESLVPAAVSWDPGVDLGVEVMAEAARRCHLLLCGLA